MTYPTCARQYLLALSCLFRLLLFFLFLFFLFFLLHFVLLFFVALLRLALLSLGGELLLPLRGGQVLFRLDFVFFLLHFVHLSRSFELFRPFRLLLFLLLSVFFRFFVFFHSLLYSHSAITPLHTAHFPISFRSDHAPALFFNFSLFLPPSFSALASCLQRSRPPLSPPPLLFPTSPHLTSREFKLVRSRRSTALLLLAWGWV
mmetsp:Transcript_488/g.972  ORF Transcript_488/g.972 Transcript_488/m.972 type:complete len:203 (-) Transcript_488:1036-1644(-)